MKKALGFIFGLSITIMTSFVSAGGPLEGCIGECRQDLVDCRELGQRHCAAQFESCKRNCD